MTAFSRSVDDFCGLLCRQQRNVQDWVGVIALANRTMLTPALRSAVQSIGDVDVPPDVRSYLDLLYNCNTERNRSIRSQLIETCKALNEATVMPALLKGAAVMLAAPAAEIGQRMTGDIDLGVEPGEEIRATACLRGMGYKQVEGMRGMARSGSVAIVELRARRPAPEVSPQQERLELDGEEIVIESARVRMPSTTSLAMHWLVHDLVKEGDYRRLRLNLRHLKDLADLERCGYGIDWARISVARPGMEWRDAIGSQRLMLRDLMGVGTPPLTEISWRAHRHHQIRLALVCYPWAGKPVRLGADAAWGMRRAFARDDASWRGTSDLLRRANRALVGRTHTAKL